MISIQLQDFAVRNNYQCNVIVLKKYGYAKSEQTKF